MALICLWVVLVNAETLPYCHSEPQAKNLSFDYYLKNASVVQLIGSAPIETISPIRVYPCQYPCLSALTQKYNCSSSPTNTDTVIKQAPDKWLSEDKFWHFALSLALTGSSYHFVRYRLDEPEPRASVYSLGFTLGCGLGKELYDSRKPRGYFSYKDLLFDLAGIGAGYLLFIHTYH